MRTLAASALALAIASALTACGGGSGNARPDAPPPTPPVPQTCKDTTASNYGGALPCVYRYNGIKDNLLVPINADTAHAEGYTGKGVKVGILDSAVHPDYAPLMGQVDWFKDYTGHAGEKDPGEDDGHGDMVAVAIAGKPSANFKGGVAPDARLYWGAVCWGVEGCWGDQAEDAIKDMTAQGVRLFNASFNSGDGITSNSSWYAKYIGPSLVSADALIVFAAGNEGYANPGGLAFAPAIDPALEKHWLTVIAVDVDKSGNVTGKSDYSAACGAAAQWCLAAPGATEMPKITSTDYGDGSGLGAVQGTSLAAPRVTGTAALVWQAFPWMSASNVHDTILTTATDLGAAGVDAIYGWGLVNAGKAVHGPAQFVDSFTANVTGSGTFSNDISGKGGLVKKGSGTLTLTGSNTYAGASHVQAGTLALTGKLASNVTVDSGATFASMGGKINGHYNPQWNATTAIQVGTGLSITGNASLTGTLHLLPENASYTVKPTETLLTAGKVDGTFNKVTYGSGLFWSAKLGYTGTSVTAEMTRTSAAAQSMAVGASAAVVAGGQQADAFLGYVDGAFKAGTASQQMQDMAGALASASTLASGETSLASLTGQVHGVARMAGVQQAMNTGSLLADRTRSLGAFGESGVWAQATNHNGELSRAGYSAATYSSEGVMVGVDTNHESGLTTGAALGSNRNRAKLDGLEGRFDGTNVTAAVYGRTELGSKGYLAGNLSVERNTVKSQREVLVGDEAFTVTGKREDEVVQARIEAGWALASGVAPYFAVGALRQEQGAIEEQGGKGFGLVAGKDAATVTFADLGLRFDKQIGAWTLGGSASARRILGGVNTDFAASFADAQEAGFLVDGPALGRDSFRIGAHLFYRTSGGWVWYATAGAEQGAAQASNGYASAGVKVGF